MATHELGGVGGMVFAYFVSMPLGLYGKTFTVISAADEEFKRLYDYYKRLGVWGHEIVAKAVYDLDLDLTRKDSKSSFNPALMDMLVQWFTSEGEWILDPFSGGPVRGLVSAMLGRNYLGIDIRPEQIQRNLEVASSLMHLLRGKVEWRVGDSAKVLDDVSVVPELPYRHIITCPPYFDLERYGGPDGDLSEMDYDEFRRFYREIIHKALARLTGDGFSIWVVGNVRKGEFIESLDIPTINYHLEAGYRLYNDICFITPIGTAAYRANVNARRLKMTRIHQMVLVFATPETIKRLKEEPPRSFVVRNNAPSLF
jgi:tRNA G10  N-methylase Trm11